LKCVEVIDQFDDEWGRYRQTSFNAIKDDCRDVMVRSAMKEDGIAIDAAKKQDYEMVVWPTRQPAAIGQLIELDKEGEKKISLIGQGEFTVRVSEKATDSGYAWNAPDPASFKCVTLDTTNLGDFTTGFQQWKFTAKDDKLKCEDKVKLVKSDNAADKGTEVEFKILVEKKACDANLECPTGEIVDGYYCGCIAEPAVVGELLDWRDSSNWSRDIIFFVPGDQITVRESSATPEGRTYTHELPEDMKLECVKEVSRFDTGYWRQIVFEGTNENCVEEIKRGSLIGSGRETVTFKVYPEDEPPVLGVLFDLDASEQREISVQSEGYLTVRANEAATATGYAWETPKIDDL